MSSAKDGTRATSFNHSGAASYAPFERLLAVGTVDALTLLFLIRRGARRGARIRPAPGPERQHATRHHAVALLGRQPDQQSRFRCSRTPLYGAKELSCLPNRLIAHDVLSQPRFRRHAKPPAPESPAPAA